MIRVDVPFKKCQSCVQFLPNVHFYKTYGNNELIDLETVVSCSHRDLCAILYSEAKKDLEKKNT